MDNLVEGTESFLIDWIIDSTVTPSNVMLDNNQTNITIIDTTCKYNNSIYICIRVCIVV